MEDSEIFAAVGGQPAFDALVDAFYEGVEQDAPLRALYAADLGPGKRHLAMFLAQRFGGPPVYSQERGHPRLRRRHMGFVVDAAARDAWIRHMLAALRAVPVFTAYEAPLQAYFEDTATFLINC